MYRAKKKHLTQTAKMLCRDFSRNLYFRILNKYNRKRNKEEKS